MIDSPSVPTIGFLFQKINKYNQQFPSIFLFFSAFPSDTDPGGKMHIYTEKSSVQAKSLFILLCESNQWRSRLPAGVLGIYKNVQMTSKMASLSWSKSKLFYIYSFVTVPSFINALLLIRPSYVYVFFEMLLFFPGSTLIILCCLGKFLYNFSFLFYILKA